MKLFFILSLLVAYVAADCYMHNPSGTNNRLNEANVNRNNANRLFDSQNNGKGGYCWSPTMTYYEDSLLRVEWTTQHACGNPKLCCNTVIQYMCQPESVDDAGSTIRDGARLEDPETDTPNENNYQETAEQPDGTTVFRYGGHEPKEWFDLCERRERNKGLFTADQNVNNNQGARATRQNPNGGKRGWECPEERDYWPYWHPTPWKDIAVFVDDPDSTEDFFKKNSFNVRDYNYCLDNDKTNNGQLPNNQVACEADGGVWETAKSIGGGQPDVLKSFFNTDNQLGNTGGKGVTGRLNGGFTNYYEWRIPQVAGDENQRCILRIRYNISTTDIDAEGAKRCQQWSGNFVDSKFNDELSPVSDDPVVSVFGGNLKLAIDTTQFGRTFQDRSQVFMISKRPSSVDGGSRIYNLNSRGKRGNIVQAYPATEYDFVPQELEVRNSDYIHFQYSGCDTNPNGNAGEGTAGTDRTNIVQIEHYADNYPAEQGWLADNSFFGSVAKAETFANIGQTACKDPVENDLDQDDEENCAKLNGPGANYFDGGAVKVEKEGTFYFMSTRNNNFTNRGQKSVIKSVPLLPVWAIAIIAVGGFLFLSAIGAAGVAFYAKSHPHTAIGTHYTTLTSKI